MKKVYCKNCKYYKDRFKNMGCKKTDAIIRNGGYVYHPFLANELLKTVGKKCEFYKRIWWKFWIKE